MASQTGKGTIKEFMGKTLSTPIAYEFAFDTFASKADAIAANKWPSDADEYVLAKLNKQAEATAKAGAYNEAIKSTREEYEKTDEFKLKQMVDSIMATGKVSLEAATALAQSVMSK